METPKVTNREKEMYGEDAAKYTSGYNAYMKEKENAETPQQLETIEKRFKQFEDTFDSKTIGVALRLMDEEREKKNDGGNVEKKEKKENLEKILQAGEDSTDRAIVEIMKYIPGSEGPPKGLVDLLEPVLRKAGEFYRKNKKENETDKEERIKKAPGGKAFPDLTGDGEITQADILKGRGVFGHGGESSMSILVPMEKMPVDTYPNIPPEEMEEALESQLPDDEMEDKYVDYVLSESLSDDEQEYLMDALEKDERLSDIMDKVITVAGEFTGEGEVKGPGTGVSDSIPARLSDGEFVFTRKATDQIGAEKLQRMMDDAERDYDKGELKKMAFGGMNQMMDDPTMDDRRRRQVDMFGIMPEDEQEEEIKRQMISSNRMPSVR